MSLACEKIRCEKVGLDSIFSQMKYSLKTNHDEKSKNNNFVAKNSLCGSIISSEKLADMNFCVSLLFLSHF